MDKVKILVVEDELIIAEDICETLTEFGYTTLEPAIDYTEAMCSIAENKPDIAILDIYLSGKKTGIDIAKQIMEKYNFPFIFLTANSDPISIEKTKEVLPFAYLIKPFSKNELYASIEIALHNFSQKLNLKREAQKNYLFVEEKKSWSKVYFDDILFLKSAHVYVEIYLKNNKKILTRGGLNTIIKRLNDSFFRVHRSYVVNVSFVSQKCQNFIKIKDFEIPIGRTYKEDLEKKLT